jgi:Putative effector of murein hydrolase
MEDKYLMEILFAVLTLAAYLGGRFLYQRTKWMLLNPVLLATALIIAFLALIKVDVELYATHTEALKYLLNLSVVALGFLLYQYYDIMMRQKWAIFIAAFAGSLLALLSVWGIMYVMGAQELSIITMLPKSVTTPIAVVLSGENGGMVSVTAVMVVLGGILGAVLGPWFLRLTGIRSSVAKGIALGAASHGIGTAKALELGAVEGAAGGLAIALMGVFTSLLMGLLKYIL